MILDNAGNGIDFIVDSSSEKFEKVILGTSVKINLTSLLRIEVPFTLRINDSTYTKTEYEDIKAWCKENHIDLQE